MSNVFRWTALCLFFLNLSYFAWAVLDSSSDKKVINNLESQPAQTASSLRLLSETSVEHRGSLGGNDAQLATSDAGIFEASASEPYCPALGPFEDKALVQKIGTELASAGLNVLPRSEMMGSSEKFRVYLPSYPDREQATDALKKLRAKKIDSYIMSEVGFANAISLGIFSLQESANGLVKKMNSYGYQAQVASLTYNREVFWIDVKSNSDPEKTDQIIVSAMTKWDGITRVDSPCKSVALAQ